MPAPNRILKISSQIRCQMPLLLHSTRHISINHQPSLMSPLWARELKIWALEINSTKLREPKFRIFRIDIWEQNRISLLISIIKFHLILFNLNQPLLQPDSLETLPVISPLLCQWVLISSIIIIQQSRPQKPLLRAPVKPKPN